MAKSAIAIVIADLGAGGAQKIALSLAQYLAAKGRKISLITLSSPETDFYAVPENITRISLHETGSSANAVAAIVVNLHRAFKLRRALNNTGADTALSFIAPMNILSILATRFMPVRVIISERNDPARQSFGGFWDVLRIIFYRFADMVTANSETAINAMKSYVPVRKLCAISNQLMPPESRYLSADKEKIILAVGRLHPQKGFDTLLSAFAIFHKTHPDWTLVILGDGVLRENLAQKAGALNIVQAVRFAGLVKNPYEFYARALVFALPSRHEGTPNALLEAMSCGLCPVVSTSSAGALDYVIPGKSGLVFETGAAQDLAACLSKLADNEALRMELGLAAEKQVSALYGDSIFQQWISVLEAVP